MVIPKTSIKYSVKASDALARSISGGGSTGGGMRTMGALDCTYTFLEATPGVEDIDTDTLIYWSCDDLGSSDPGNFDCSFGNCPGGGGGGGGGDVATTDPVAGLPCDGSPSALGTSNLPGGTSGWGTTVVNIFGLQDSNATTYGWIYQNAHQDLFFQRNANDTNTQVGFLTGILQDIPGINAIAQALVDATTSPYQLTADQANNIEGSWKASTGKDVHHCFTGPLSPPVG